MPSNIRWRRRTKWIVALVSTLVTLAIGEASLRLLLFHTRVDIAAKEPEYYARTQDELWIYRYLFTSNRRWAVAAGPVDAANDTGIEFYRNWATSLVPDAELGYVRKPDVATPCHETTNLATRGTRPYSWTGRKIVFLGDSFVESAACANDTLATKLEALTGIDTLNFGIGGYGVDQIYLYLKRIAPQCNRPDCLFLIGVIADDVDRMLLAVRASPKPYFTIAGDKLVLHTDHIHPASLNDYYERPPERSYLYYFVRGRLGFPVYRSMMRDTREQRRNATYAIAQLVFRDIAALVRDSRFQLAFVVFPTRGNPFDTGILSLLRAQQIPVVDLQGCLSGRPDTELYAELHPTSLGNEMLARCLARDLAAMGLLR